MATKPKKPLKTCRCCGGNIFDVHKKSKNIEIKIIKRAEEGGRFEIHETNLCENCAAQLVEEWIIDWLKMFKGDMTFDEFQTKHKLRLR